MDFWASYYHSNRTGSIDRVQSSYANLQDVLKINPRSSKPVIRGASSSGCTRSSLLGPCRGIALIAHPYCVQIWHTELIFVPRWIIMTGGQKKTRLPKRTKATGSPLKAKHDWLGWESPKKRFCYRAQSVDIDVDSGMLWNGGRRWSSSLSLRLTGLEMLVFASSHRRNQLWWFPPRPNKQGRYVTLKYDDDRRTERIGKDWDLLRDRWHPIYLCIYVIFNCIHTFTVDFRQRFRFKIKIPRILRFQNNHQIVMYMQKPREISCWRLQR